jgi:hypothetical protein
VAPILIRFERFPVFHTFTSGGGNDFLISYEPVSQYADFPTIEGKPNIHPEGLSSSI